MKRQISSCDQSDSAKKCVCFSYPAGNSSRHMGQLCSSALPPPPPPPAAFPSSLTTVFTSSCSFTSSPSFWHIFCTETGLFAAVDDADAVGRHWGAVVWSLWHCLGSEESCVSGGAASGGICAERAGWGELVLAGSGPDEVLRKCGDGSGKGATSSLRSHHRWSSCFSVGALYGSEKYNRLYNLDAE